MIADSLQCFLLVKVDDLNDFVLDRIDWYLEPEKKIQLEKEGEEDLSEKRLMEIKFA